MWLTKVLLFILLQLSVEENVESTISLIDGLQPVDSDCDIVQREFDTMNYLTDYQCLFLSTEHVDCPLNTGNLTIFTITLDQMISGLVFNYQKIYSCDVVLAVIKDFKQFSLIVRQNSFRNMFRPFTRVDVLATKFDHFDDILDKVLHPKEILTNALYFNFVRSLNDSHYQIQDAVSKRVISFSEGNELKGYMVGRKNYLLHPLFGKHADNYPEHDFKISLFNCPPFVIKLDDNMTMDSYDGAEFRFFKEIARHWNVTIYDRSFLFDTGGTWIQVADDVADQTTDTGLCSMGLTEHSFSRMELSNYFSHLCTTFLVPKPKPMTTASYIYIPLSATVWWVTLAVLFVTVLLYYILLRLLGDNSDCDHWESLSRVCLDVINIATSHGVPKVVTKIPIRILLCSWLMTTLLLGAAYNSKYTSILTRPLYTKPVDDLQDFLDAGLFWGQVGERRPWTNEFQKTGDPLHMEMPNRYIVEKDYAERLKYIPMGNYARYVKVLGNNYVTDTETFYELIDHLRLMKTCVRDYYTIFPFGKNSPYTSYVNQRMGWYISAGIVNHWFRRMATKYGRTYMRALFDKNQERVESVAKSLQINNIIGSFILLACGLGLASIVYLFEVYAYNRKVQAGVIVVEDVNWVAN